ncbi:hypothetical protein SUDANB95_08013 (plasmid) [Actinosynnema sp. ALI-1.44]
MPRSAVGWLFGIELLVTALTLWASLSAEVRLVDLLRFAAFLLCAVLYAVGTREPEERRREAQRHGHHVDQTSVWVFGSALLVPVPLVVVLVVVVRIQRYLIARRPPGTFVFTTAAIVASALGVHAVAVTTPLRSWLTGERAWPVDAAGMVVAGTAVAAAVAVYFLAQALLVGVARGLMHGSWSLQELLGDRRTNWFILTTLFLAVCAGLAHALSPLLTLLLVPVVVRASRIEQQVQQLRAERDGARSDSLHDPLTGLFNRRGFDASAALTLVNDQNTGRETAMLFLDLDHFKRWNKLLGHIGADGVLEAVAAVLREETRHGDVVSRWGGEEFAVVLPDTGVSEAVAIAERIRSRIAGLRITVSRPAGGRPIKLGQDGVPRCTISIGVAVAPCHGIELADLQELADQALEYAKDHGRDQVVLAPCGSDRVPSAVGGPVA